MRSADALRGRGGWVWYVERCGGAAGIVARARQAGMSHVLVKGGDGGDLWPQLSADLVRSLKSQGLAVAGWQYCYGEHPTVEAAVAGRMLDTGVDAYVADVEAEYEGRWRAAEEFARAVRGYAGERAFAYAPLPVIDLHLALPYVQMNAHCDLVMPQLYTRALGAWPLEALYAIWERWGATWAGWGVPMPPLAPIGETFGEATPDDVRAFETAARARGLSARSYWALDHARPEHLAALAAADAAETSTPPAVTGALDGIWAATERLARIGHEAEALEVQRQVVHLKRALGVES